MLLFIGDQTNGYWIEEPARVNGQSVEYVDANINIKNQTNDILRIRPEKVNYIVYDLEQYGINATEIADEIYSIAQAGNAEPIFIATSFLPTSELVQQLQRNDLEQYGINATEIADEIYSIAQAGNAEPIFIATSFLPTSELVQQLQRRGFNKFIFPYDESLRKDELEKCINGYYNQKSPEQLLDIKKEDISLSAKNKVSIGIAGACTRIGTTTHAIQIVKHLLYCGKKACYIEINGTGFVRDLLEAYMPERACTRIGTTTHAIQIVKHLLYCGKKACYIEINGTGFVRDLLEAYMPESVNEEKGLVSFENVDLYYRQDLIPEILHMDYEYYVYDYGTFSDQDFNKISLEKGLVSFENVDLYYRQDLIPEILHMDYEYYVYDYGTFSDQDFNKISFMEKNVKVMVLGSKPNEIQKSTQLITSVFYQDIYYLFNFTAKADQDDLREKNVKVMVLGSKPNEIQKSTQLITSVFYQDIYYLFNFTAKADQDDLREMMEQKGERTFFTEYCPDMFYYEPKEYCKAIFPEVIPEKKDIKPKKRKWWNRK